MIAVDTNVLVAFHRLEYVHHLESVRCLTSLAEGSAPWGIPWPCVHEFLAVVTNHRIFKHPTPISDALDVVGALMESPGVRMLSESGKHFERLSGLLVRGKIAGARVHDCRIAAICLDNGIKELWTADRDFSRFPELRTRNPLIS